MNPIIPNSPANPSFGKNVGDNTLATLKDVNLVIEEVNTITTDITALEADVLALTPTYKLYIATLTQSGTNAPVATVLENTLGGTLVWSYVGVGDYLATLVAAFPTATKVVLLMGPKPTGNFELFVNNANSLGLSTYDGAGNPANGQLANTTIEIRVYP